MAKEAIGRVLAAEEAADAAEKQARAEAADIVREARKKAEEIIAEARAGAEKIINAKTAEAAARANDIAARFDKKAADNASSLRKRADEYMDKAVGMVIDELTGAAGDASADNLAEG
jgi:vacuolar-type H+-ATPase subunit H